MNPKLLRAVKREQRNGAQIEVIREKIDVTLGPMIHFDEQGRVIGGTPGDVFRQFVYQYDLRVTRVDGTVLVPIGDRLMETNR